MPVWIKATGDLTREPYPMELVHTRQEARVVEIDSQAQQAVRGASKLYPQHSWKRVKVSGGYVIEGQ
jgi:hypothetical protein